MDQTKGLLRRLAVTGTVCALLAGSAGASDVPLSPEEPLSAPAQAPTDETVQYTPDSVEAEIFGLIFDELFAAIFESEPDTAILSPDADEAPLPEAPGEVSHKNALERLDPVTEDFALPGSIVLYADRDLIGRTEETLPDLLQPAPVPSGETGLDREDEDTRQQSLGQVQVSASSSGRRPGVVEEAPEVPAEEAPVVTDPPAAPVVQQEAPAVPETAPVVETPSVPMEQITDTQTIISGERLKGLMEVNPEYVLFEKQGVALSIPTQSLRALELDSTDLLTVTIQTTSSGFTFSLSANDREVTELGEMLVRMPAALSDGASLSLRMAGSEELLDTHIEEQSGLLCAHITCTGAYELVEQFSQPLPQQAVLSETPAVQSAPAQQTAPRQTSAFPAAQLGLFLSVFAAGGALALWLKRRA